MSALSDLLKGSTAVKTPTKSGGSALANLVSKSATPTLNTLPPATSRTPAGGTRITVPSGNEAYKTPSGSIQEFLPNGTKQVTLADQFGGGAYNINTKNPASIINTGHTTYGGVSSQPGMNRDDIIPVSLGGTNTNPKNINVVPASQNPKEFETNLAAQVKSGKMTLGQAREAILNYKNQKKPSLLSKIGNVADDILGSATKAIGLGALTELPDAIRGAKQDNVTPKQVIKEIPKATNTVAKQVGSAVFDPVVSPALGVQQEITGKDAGQVETPFGTFQSPQSKRAELKQQGASKLVSNLSPVASQAANSLAFVGTFAGLDALATKATLRLAELAKTKTGIELTKADVQSIVNGEQVEPQKLQAFKEAANENPDLAKQIRTGQTKLNTTQETPLSKTLESIATKPLGISKPPLQEPAIVPEKPISTQTERVPKTEGGKPLAYETVEPVQVATPEIKTSKLAQGVENKAVAAKLADSFEGKPEYAKVNVADQAKAASNLLTADRQKAISVAMGHELPPEGVLPESVFVAVENHALETKDVNLLRDLATSSSLTSEATGMGQRIRMLAERNPDSAVASMQKVMKIKEEAVVKKYGDVKKAKTKIKNEIKTEIQRAAPKVKDWDAFLEQIKCT